ncbi:MAG: OmpL47-type beta-barrel domain-containing protein, partial [Bryobacteraceae bacterium]
MLTLDLSTTNTQGPTLISVDVDGLPFACPDNATSCQVPLPEGGAATYGVTASNGTASGSLGYKRDATPPEIDGQMSGTLGDNDYFISNEIEFTATADDPVSQVASFECWLDGALWDGSTRLTLADGEHTFTCQAQNGAGLQSEMAQTIKVDATTPVLDISLTGAPCSNSWYCSQVQVVLDVDDSGSGIASIRYSVDGSDLIDYGGPFTLKDGEHTVNVVVFDQAGHKTELSQTVKVDTITPLINLSITGTPGSSGYFVSNIQVSVPASDSGSGLSSLECSVDNGAWTTNKGPVSFADGQHTLQCRAYDNAGNVTITPVQTYQVDTTAPMIDLPAAWNLGETIEYEVTDSGSRVASTCVVIEDEAERFQKLRWCGEAKDTIAWDGRFKDGARAPVGAYYATLTARDQAGNESKQTGVITVENNLFTLFLPPFTPPSDTPLPEGAGEIPVTSFGDEDNGQASASETTSVTAGGLASSLDGTEALEFGTPKPGKAAGAPFGDFAGQA